MTKDEAIKYLIRPVSTSNVPSEEIEKQFQAYEMAIEALKQKPIIHAHWRYMHRSKSFGLFVGACSNCGSPNIVANYCGNCGAKMDEEIEDA